MEAHLDRIGKQIARLDDKGTAKLSAVLAKIDDGAATKTTVWSALAAGVAIGVVIVGLFVLITA